MISGGESARVAGMVEVPESHCSPHLLLGPELKQCCANVVEQCFALPLTVRILCLRTKYASLPCWPPSRGSVSSSE